MSSLICSAPGRVCLFGDHMDWCGRQAITAAVDMRIFLKSRRENTYNVEVHSFSPFSVNDKFPLSSIDLDINTDLRYVQGVISAMNRTIPYTLNGMNLRFSPRRSYLNNNRRKPILPRSARKQRALLLRSHRFRSDISSSVLNETPRLASTFPRRHSLRCDLPSNDCVIQNVNTYRRARPEANSCIHRTSQAILQPVPYYN